MFWQDMKNEDFLSDGTWHNCDVAGIWNKGTDECYSVGMRIWDKNTGGGGDRDDDCKGFQTRRQTVWTTRCLEMKCIEDCLLPYDNYMNSCILHGLHRNDDCRERRGGVVSD